MLRKTTFWMVLKAVWYDLFVRTNEANPEQEEYQKKLDAIRDEAYKEAKEACKENPDLVVVYDNYGGYEAVRCRKVKPDVNKRWWIYRLLGYIERITFIHFISRNIRWAAILHGCKTPAGWASVLHDFIERYLYKTPAKNHPIRYRIWRAFFDVNFLGCPWCHSKLWRSIGEEGDDNNIDIIDEWVSPGIEESTYTWKGWKTCPDCGYCQYVVEDW